jgi:HD-GYP domain-containing protein (c-di-GMP phosphodiesterase class II)
MIGQTTGDLLLARDAIRREVEAHSGEWFSPASVSAFAEVSRAEAFWLGLESHHLDRAIGELAASFSDTKTVSVGGLRALAQVFARIVDDKSAFTAEHSQGVARLAGLLGQLLGRPAEECAMLEIAGLLHDLGKLRVPDAVLDKAAPLDELEFASIQRHTYETWQILRRVHALRPIAAWAAMHHERPTDGGYPFHLPAGQMPLQARIVAVADVLQAFAQDRPYRRALSKERAFSTLAAMAAQGRLDALVVARAEADQDACWAAATGLH